MKEVLGIFTAFCLTLFCATPAFAGVAPQPCGGKIPCNASEVWSAVTQCLVDEDGITCSVTKKGWEAYKAKFSNLELVPSDVIVACLGPDTKRQVTISVGDSGRKVQLRNLYVVSSKGTATANFAGTSPESKARRC
jgi:hypothetical protein